MTTNLSFRDHAFVAVAAVIAIVYLVLGWLEVLPLCLLAAGVALFYLGRRKQLYFGGAIGVDVAGFILAGFAYAGVFGDRSSALLYQAVSLVIMLFRWATA